MDNSQLSRPSLGPFNYYLVFIGFCLVSSLISKYPLEASLRSFTFIEPMLFFFFALVISANYANGFKDINKILYAGLLVTIVFAVIELITQKKILYDAGFVPKYSLVYQNELRTFSGRISSFIGQPIYAALYFFVALCIPVYLYIVSKSVTKKFGYILIILLLLLIMYATGTRAVIPAIVLFFLFAGLSFTKEKSSVLVISTVIILVSATIIVQYVPGFVKYQQDSFTLKESNESNANLLARISIAEQMFKLFQKNIYFGNGPGNIQKEAAGFMVSYSSSREGLYGQENHFLAILSDTGIFGFTAYLIFLISSLYYLFRKQKNGLGIIQSQELNAYRKMVVITYILFLAVSFSVSTISSLPNFVISILIGNYLGKLFRENNLSSTPVTSYK
ncbi:MAG: O-antigen ligase family protein [Bacteroidales bacterium]|nr:O-antigen ligase family protein [Bacteroidales bacterium]